MATVVSEDKQWICEACAEGFHDQCLQASEEDSQGKRSACVCPCPKGTLDDATGVF